MPTVNRKVEPFKHEFYAIGLLFDGTITEWHGQKELNANIIFNSPYQLISWNIVNDWKGYYLMFTQDYLSQSNLNINLLLDFPFLKLDEVKPIRIPNEYLEKVQINFENIIEEYNSANSDKFKFIDNYLSLILHQIKRFSEGSQSHFFASGQNRNSEINLVSRYQALIEGKLNSENVNLEYLSTSFYSKELNIHPNYLNAIVKRVSGLTAKQMIQDKIVLTAKALLIQSNLSVKEIAYKLGYEEATHFSSFFKKNTGFTPLQYKETSNL
jgi:AraC family transcriptional regulator, transcriptional activator of pobA